MADPDSFDAGAYLQTRFFIEAKDRVQFQLNKLHDLFKTVEGLKVIDFGCGPVIQNSISAAAHAAEIVFSDYSPSNREAVQKWLNGEKDAFNWSPHFDYVVKTLEGKGEKEAREREEKMRQISKVAFCDALSQTPMEKGFEGPYDIVLEFGCLDAACANKQSFERSMNIVASLVKPGGTFVRWSPNGHVDIEDMLYRVGGSQLKCIRLTKEYVASLLNKSGFKDVHVDFTPVIPENASLYEKEIETTTDGYHFISATKI